MATREQRFGTKTRRLETADAPVSLNQYRTPQVTIEAIMICVRERGLAALQEPANRERLSRCDEAARAEIERRIKKITQ
jgi:hypothetical protein